MCTKFYRVLQVRMGVQGLQGQLVQEDQQDKWE